MTPDDWITLSGTLLGGIAIGWLLREWYRAMGFGRPRTGLSERDTPAGHQSHAAQDGRESRPRQLQRRLEQVEAALAQRQQAIDKHEADLTKANADLAHRDRELEALRTRLERRDAEQAELVSELGELRGRMTEAGADIYRLQQDLIRRERELSASMEAVAERDHQLELLTQIDAGFRAEMDELTQQIQLEDGEVTRLKSVLKAKEMELSDAQGLLAQRETELSRIIREREDIERRVEQARQHRDLVQGEHDRLLTQLRDIADQTDMRARLLRAMREQSREETESLLVSDTEADDVYEGQQQPLPELGPSEDDLTQIRGIGEGYEGMLKAAGISSFEQLASASPDQLRQVLMAPAWREPNVEAWIAESRAMTGVTSARSSMDAGEVDVDEDAVDDEMAWLEGAAHEHLGEEDDEEEGDDGDDDDMMMEYA